MKNLPTKINTSNNSFIRRLRLNSSLVRRISTARFGIIYALVAGVILLGTTLLWAILGANLQSVNADQLTNAYLFEHPEVFRDALWPSAHSFLIKWPLFSAIKHFGFSTAAFSFFTVGLVLITIGALAAIIWRLEKRPWVFGTLWLALASVLLLIPAQPYPGGILPVNMAMLTTRNFEYIVYIVSLMLFVKFPRVRSVGFWVGVALLGLLIASDRLFLTLSLGGALLALVAYALSRGWNLVSLSVNWLVGSVLASALALTIIWWLSSMGITNFVNQSSFGPYGVVHNAKDLLLAIFYALAGLFTNFGANPAYDSTIVRHFFQQSQHRLISLGGPAFIINVIILITGLFTVFKVTAASFAHNKNKEIALRLADRLSLMLVWTSAAALIVFVASNHYYAVDSRYLAISLFAVFISMAAYTRNRSWQSPLWIVSGAVIILGILLGVTSTVKSYNDNKLALAPMKARNSLIAEALSQHPVNALVGDYWRVIPTKLAAKNKINVVPLSGCSQVRDTLSSKAWQPDLHNHSFAYLLSLENSLTDYPNCNLDQVISNYGRPNSSIVIAGTVKNPKEILLFYDRGIKKSAPVHQLKIPSTVLPVALEDLPYTTCKGPTIMNIVAHQDDDLLFMNPDLLHDIKASHCVRSVYVTAGDAGSGQFYWLSREQGTQAAYSYMLGTDDVWIERIVEVNDHEFITVSNPRGNSNISLVFLHFPDGNMKGQGFAATHYETISKLYNNQLPLIHAVYANSTFTSDELTATLVDLMHLYMPTEIRTQSARPGSVYIDHVDHNTVGRFAQRAHDNYVQQQFEGRINIPLNYYLGYPIHEQPPNVAGEDLMAKETAFIIYGNHDGGVCHSMRQCADNPAYGAYLPRQYRADQ
jgi:LmbE family N-acetylglucosaminyl deacetylase